MYNIFYHMLLPAKTIHHNLVIFCHILSYDYISIISKFSKSFVKKYFFRLMMYTKFIFELVILWTNIMNNNIEQYGSRVAMNLYLVFLYMTTLQTDHYPCFFHVYHSLLKIFQCCTIQSMCKLPTFIFDLVIT